MIPEASQTLNRCIYAFGIMSTVIPDESQYSWLTKRKALLRKYWKMLCCHLSGSDLTTSGSLILNPL